MKRMQKAAAALGAAGILLCAVVCSAPLRATELAVGQGGIESNQTRVLATSKTSTLEKELNEAAESGFRFSAVMGGETAFGGKEVVAVVTRSATSSSPGRFAYIFESLLGGQEVVVILERDKDSAERGDYKLIATSKTSTLEKELLEAGKAGYTVVGMTVSKTAIGGKEIVAIVRRSMAR